MLKQMALTSEAFAGSSMPSLSPFPFFHVEAEHNKAPAVWACLSECPLSLMLTFCPFISPHLLRDAAPREISEGSMGSASLERWCIVLRCCAHLCVLCSCTGLLMGHIYVLFCFFWVWVCVPSVRTKRQDCHYLSCLSTFLKTYQPFYRRKVKRKKKVICSSFSWCSFWNVGVVLFNEMQDGLSALWHNGENWPYVQSHFSITLMNLNDFICCFFFSLCALLFPHLSL